MIAGPTRRAVLALLVASSPPNSRDAAFQAKPLAKGATVKVESTFELSTKVKTTVQGEENEASGSEKRQLAATITVTDADEKGPTVLAVEFGKCAGVLPSHEDHDVSPDTVPVYSEKKYQATRGPRNFVVTGSAVLRRDEREATSELLAPLQGKAPLASVLEGKSLAVGAKVDVPVVVAETATALFVAQLKTTASDVSLVSFELEATDSKPASDADRATFHAKAQLEKHGEALDPATYQVTLVGDVVVSRASCRLLAATLEGPVAIGFNHKVCLGPIDASGSGQMSWKYSAEVK